MNDPATAEQPEYLEAWSLRCHPFEDRLDPQFFYAGSSLMQRLDLLTHLVQFGESVVVVSGPGGSGKSSLLGQFLGHINPQWTTCLIDGNQHDPLSGKLAETLGGAPGDDEQTLLSRWAGQSDTSQHLVILIDNAEHLDDAACQRLCKLTTLPDSDRLRIVVFGTAETEQRVRTALEQLGSKRTAQTLEIPRLSEEETASYLMYRLAVAGYSGESPFTPTEVRAICKAADGRPGKINCLAHQSMIEHHLRARNKKRAPIPRSANKSNTPRWIVVSLAIAVVAGYFGWQRLTPGPELDHSSEPPAPVVAELPLELPASPLPATDADDDIEPLAEQPAPVAQEALDANAPPAKLTQADVNHQREETPVVEDKAATTAAVTTDTTKPPKPADRDRPATVPPVTSVEPENQETSPADESAATSQGTSVALTDSTTKSPVPAVVEKPEPAIPTAQPLPASAPGQPHREDWLLQQQPTTFTLQLLGSRDQPSIAAFIKRNALDPAKTAYYRGRYRNADWYVLLYGIYPDKATALAARSTLPGRVQKGKPWSRSLKSVQDSINEAR